MGSEGGVEGRGIFQDRVNAAEKIAVGPAHVDGGSATKVCCRRSMGCGEEVAAGVK